MSPSTARRRAPLRGTLLALLGAAALGAGGKPAAAQVARPETPAAARAAQLETRIAADSAPPGHLIRWYEPVALAGGIALISALDQPVTDHFRAHHSGAGDDVSTALRHFGAPEVYGTVTAGLLAGGLLAHDRAVTRAGLRLGASLLLAGASAEALKLGVGRERPNENPGAYDFDPLSGHGSFPSGHTTLAFALATSLADEIHRTWATVALYGVATGVAWSRVYDREHWLSDVAGGAAVGIGAAKLVNGRWRIGGLRPPRFLAGPRGAAIGWRLAFR